MLNAEDDTNLKMSDKCVALLKFTICYTWENIKKKIKQKC